ncbi:chromosomal replication initiator protein DnaA [Candidatus Gottesmanbacteria bacterium RIFCSPLOWO2_02_FULL_42_29]|uniref:Chromosomal replication initiator protein DnaA n=2 Tax=Candidatus Gottesmaniibacteriota TaxID=1752720 RepID=A0A1F6BJG2_9BACT|nr:MAG: Chromosomal replication initiator protein DnaA [Candidatus Gottesmanbacteria bacterium GW2011_GWA2_42_18]OGG10949.1 MAG: chromosomal replication initiator protein DnaA [Candidatus Gottesmanbacteria bacterium RIFCSPHIGHO2_01_FULL_42_27]OGG22248.1 MAG: chromosomal replication initiator protein DnaA [Candidatus Gottesmanbacteria bacterium RIFCSPHIGHO2_12_FULL_43_26]OGG33210.1 MAG: chromosomal replication initiator protein DnaA [Candidatus Gottesmanbacteria bacterium RIFCSPLOWO2_12_FULL_42_1
MDSSNLWQTVLADLQLQVSKVVFQTLISQTSLEVLNETEAVINCHNPMLINLIEKRYQTLIKETLKHYTQKDLNLTFRALRKKSNGDHIDGPLFRAKTAVYEIPVNIERLNKDYTFANFAVSSTNQMAYAAATAVSKTPGLSYNPLFLYGSTGVGKTHLMQAIGHSVQENNPRLKMIFSTGEEFTNEIIEAISNKTTTSFKKKYRRVDLLMIDDVQFIAGKYSIQEEFFHTFNAVYQAKKQIVITSDRPPEEIDKLEARLRSRFEGGLTIDIGAPDFELRTAILLIKAKQRRVDLPIEAAKLLSANIENPRKLEGILIRVISESQIKDIPLDSELVKSVLGKTLKIPPKEKIFEPEEVVRAVSSFYNLKVSELKGGKRDKIFSLPRQILYYILRTEVGTGLAEIGELLGGRDHTTVLYGVRKISDLIGSDEKIRVDIVGIKNQLSG